MKLLTEELKAKLPKLYSQEKNPNPAIVCKFFTPWSNWTWYVTEGQEEIDEDTKQKTGDWLFFGLVDGMERELGYFRLSELESIKGPFGLKIERDLYFGKKNLKDIGL